MKTALHPSIELTQVDPRTRYFAALGGLFLALLPLIPLWIVCVKLDRPLWLLPIYAGFAAALVIRYAVAAHSRFGYALLDDGLWLQSGVYWRKAVFVPRERVQHTEVNHGPLDRKMGLAKLVLHTAGLRLQHLTIPGLTDAQAHALRDDLLKRSPIKVTSAQPELDALNITAAPIAPAGIAPAQIVPAQIGPTAEMTTSKLPPASGLEMPLQEAADLPIVRISQTHQGAAESPSVSAPIPPSSQ